MKQKLMPLKEALHKLPGPLYQDFEHHAAVAMVFSLLETGPHLLFIKRVEDPDDPWSGHVAFPGGRVEPEDFDIQAASRRETLEEVGLDLRENALYLGNLNTLQVMGKGRVMDMGVTAFVYHLQNPVELRIDHSEVADSFWVPFEHFLQSKNFGHHEFTFREYRSHLPGCRYDEHIIWGLSYKMLGDLLEIWNGLWIHDLKICNDHYLSYPRGKGISG